MKAGDAFRMTGIAAALLAALGPARAQEILAPSGLNTAASAGSVGAGYTPDDGRRFGQYNGINESGFYGLLDFNLVKREDATGTWLGVFGRNVGLQNRQLRFDHSRQGNWAYFLEYSEQPRYEPWQITTAIAGIGSPNLTIPTTPTAGAETDLKTKRDIFGVGFDKFLAGNWDLQVRFRNEKKSGERLFARGTTGTGPAGSFGNFEFSPEPIDSTTQQLDAKLNYTGSQLQLTGGFYGSRYDNQNNGINYTGGVGALSTFTPIALPPDNESYQFNIAGGYGFTPTTRGNFKVAYAKATQDDSFVTGANVPLAPGIGNNLQGKVETTLAQAGVTSRPMPKLALNADYRYQYRDDKTPVLTYLAPPTSTSNGQNEPRSDKTTTAKAEASYALPNAFRLTGGIDYQEIWRNTSAVRIVSYRETTDEWTYRAELRRMMSETLTGSISYAYTDRSGSPWVQTLQTSGATGSNLIAPLHLADRTGNRVRMSVNWMPIEPLTLNLAVDDARYDYDTHPGSTIGPMEGEARNYAIDVAYVFSPQWQANAWYSLNDTKAEQTTCVNASSSGNCSNPTNLTWGATLKNLSNNFGAGVRGKPMGGVEIGADFSFSDIRDEYRQQNLIGTPVTAQLPDITTKLTRLNLFGKYLLQKNSGVRLDYIYDRYKTDDWTWSNWMYADGTRVTQDQNQIVNFFAVTYFHRWQ